MALLLFIVFFALVAALFWTDIGCTFIAIMVPLAWVGLGWDLFGIPGLVGAIIIPIVGLTAWFMIFPPKK